MTEAPLSLDAYFARIGGVDDRSATLSTLRAIVERHAAAIPFENLDPLLGRPVAMDAASLEAKLVHGGRGGWCFEQNHLLRYALEALGYRVKGLAARVRWELPPGVVTPRGHMVLLVELDEGPHLVDVGFGVLTLTGAVRLEPDVEQPTPHEVFKLLPEGDGFVLTARLRDEWKPLYRFGLEEQLRPDYEVTSFFLANHPASHFLSRLMVARAMPGKRFTLRDSELAVHEGGRTERRSLTTPEALREALEGTFGLRLPEGPALEAKLVELAAH